jgi:uncharacterized membrane protein
MWWNGPGGPMYGWWFMPLFGIVFLLIILFIVGRFFQGWGGSCGRPPAGRDSDIDELKKEIKALRDEVRELKDKNKKVDKT